VERNKYMNIRFLNKMILRQNPGALRAGILAGDDGALPWLEKVGLFSKYKKIEYFFSSV
jgi:hypothetical protein